MTLFLNTKLNFALANRLSNTEHHVVYGHNLQFTKSKFLLENELRSYVQGSENSGHLVILATKFFLRWCLIFVCSEYGTWLMSQIWLLEF